jgi:hypothetical protein
VEESKLPNRRDLHQISMVQKLVAAPGAERLSRLFWMVSKMAFVVTPIAALPLLVRAEVCGQLAGVKGPAVEILRIQRNRVEERIRYAMRIEASKVVPVECDDVIVTGVESSARLVLASAKLSIGAQSRIEISAHVGKEEGPAKVSLIDLTYGKIRSLVNRTKNIEATGQGSGPSSKGNDAKSQIRDDHRVEFKVRTFSAVAGVRGTDFFTSYDPNSGLTEQATIEGSVEIQQAGSSQKVLVSAGQQVAVETTAEAVRAAAEGKGRGSPPSNASEITTQVRPLKVIPIREELKNEIRAVSAVVSEDREFAHPEAIKVLGQPETWTQRKESIPEKLKDIKNEF